MVRPPRTIVGRVRHRVSGGLHAAGRDPHLRPNSVFRSDAPAGLRRGRAGDQPHAAFGHGQRNGRSLQHQASDYSTGPSTVRTALFDPKLLQFDLTTNVPAGQSVLDIIKTWPIINQMLYSAMIVQPGDQVYGGNPAHQYLGIPGPYPARTVPTRIGRCTAWPALIAGHPMARRRLPGCRSLKKSLPGHFPSRRRSTQAGMVTLRVNYGYQSATMSAFPPPQSGRPSQTIPLGRPRSGGDGQFPNYTPIGTGLRPPSAPTAGRMAWERKRRGPNNSERTLSRCRKCQRACGRFGV